MAAAFSNNFFIEDLLALKEEKRPTSSSICKAPKHPLTTFECTID